MIYSMTGFARAQSQDEWGSFVCEIRSVNHRFLEMNINLPESLRSCEMMVRETMRRQLKRGKVEVSIRYQPNASRADQLFLLNVPAVEALSTACKKIAEILSSSHTISCTDILRFPGILETPVLEMNILQTALLQLVDKALQDLITMRAREGEELKKIFLTQLNLIHQELTKIRTRLPNVLTEQQNRLKKRFLDIQLELDPLRLEQEMVLAMQKLDIAEELDRTEVHLAEMKRVLESKDLSGRRLDFLLQELNREANTLGSKSVDAVITHAVVEMKVLIEQIREQAQNVE